MMGKSRVEGSSSRRVVKDLEDKCFAEQEVA